jgi:formamidopyrimidine-DNA glycosylase
MPELPEVETTLRGLLPHVQGIHIKSVIVRNSRLRWPIPADLSVWLPGQCIQTARRRGKYIIIQLDHGSMLWHLGMSGRWRVLPAWLEPGKHDHVDILFANGCLLRYTDPRRFGAILTTMQAPEQHVLLRHLGPEPLSDAFDAHYLLQRAQARRVPIKPFIMDNKIVVGVGNIYATEALFTAGIHPAMPAGLLTQPQAGRLIVAIQDILARAIVQGGTTLNDFLSSDGKPGYFFQQLRIYGRAGQACVICQSPIQSCTLGQRGTTFCEHCQAWDDAIENSHVTDRTVME